MTIFDITPAGAGERLARIVSAPDPLELGKVSYLRPDGSTVTALLSSLPINAEKSFGIARIIGEEAR